MDDTKLLRKHISALSLMEFKWSWTLSQRRQLLYFLQIMVQSAAGHSTLYQLQLLASAEDFQKRCMFSDVSSYNSSAEHFSVDCLR